MKYVLTAIISAIIGAAVLYWYMPQNSTEVITKDRIITVTRTTKSPDGTEVTEQRKEEDKSTKEKSVELKNSPNWHISIGQTLNSAIPVYKLEVNRAILGPISIGLFGSSDKTFGASVGISF